MNKSKMILITGAAGFIGYHLTKRLLSLGYPIIGVDNMNDYYEVSLKEERLNLLEKHANFNLFRVALEDRQAIGDIFVQHEITCVVNLAAQAGVRYSIDNPHAYIDSNIVGFINILEASRHHKVEHLIYASSSSVYGANRKMPFAVTDAVDHPISLYAATKKANELMAHTYSHLYGLPATGLRFFTVYGPWGRPDMAYFSFTKAILCGTPIQIYNQGHMKRDLTFIDDIIEGIVRLIPKPPKPNDQWDVEHPTAGSSYAPYKIYNMGNHSPVRLLDFISILEDKLGIEAKKEFLPMQPGDVEETFADVSDLMNDVGFHPATPLEEGLEKFIKWYRAYYHK
jgi:UDP-glucuronate 4-epimerase